MIPDKMHPASRLLDHPPKAQVFDRGNLPSPPDTWPKFRKIVPTSMIRIDGPFVVDTSEGPLRCEDGWLAMDARGYPYPIADDEQQMIYQEVPDDHGDRERNWAKLAPLLDKIKDKPIPDEMIEELVALIDKRVKPG